MLTYVLALVVGLGSFALYMAAFFFPEVHRKYDFIWSGIGLFYALVLWVCAGRITGGVLLGQTASVALLSWLSWQTLTLRRQVTTPDQQTAVPSAAELQAMLSTWVKPETFANVGNQLSQQLPKLVTWAQTTFAQVTQPKAKPPESPLEKPYVPLTPADFASARRGEGSAPDIGIPTAKPIAKGTKDNVTKDNINQDADPWLVDVEPVSPPVVKTGDRRKPTPPAKVSATKPPVTKLPATQAPPTGNPDRPGGGLFTTLFGQAKDLFQGLGKKKESKPVYVRKQFRAPEVAGLETVVGSEAIASEAVVSEAIVVEAIKTEVEGAAIAELTETAMIVTADAATDHTVTAPESIDDALVDDAQADSLEKPVETIAEAIPTASLSLAEEAISEAFSDPDPVDDELAVDVIGAVSFSIDDRPEDHSVGDETVGDETVDDDETTDIDDERFEAILESGDAHGYPFTPQDSVIDVASHSVAPHPDSTESDQPEDNKALSSP